MDFEDTEADRRSKDEHDQDPGVKLGIGSYAHGWAVGVPGYPGHPDGIGLTANGLLHKAFTLGVKIVQIADNLPLHTLPDQQLADLEQLACELQLSIEVGTRGFRNLGAYLELAVRFTSPILHRVFQYLPLENRMDGHHPGRIAALAHPEDRPDDRNGFMLIFPTQEVVIHLLHVRKVTHRHAFLLPAIQRLIPGSRAPDEGHVHRLEAADLF